MTTESGQSASSAVDEAEAVPSRDALRKFGADLESGRRIVAMAPPETKLAAFAQFAREGVRWHSVGGLAKPDVMDGLRDVGIEAGLGETEIQDALEGAVDRPFDPSATTKANGSAAPSISDWRSRCSTAAKLQTMTFPPVSYVVPGLLPEGLTLLAGKPKIGKSWLALDLCLSVAGNHPCMGKISPTAGDVLYIALEDNPRRLQRRIKRLLGDAVWSQRLTLATEWPRLDKGGVEDIREWMNSVTEARLVVVDTLAGVRPIRATTGYTDDYETLSALHRLANERGVAVLVLHHTRKMAADDPIDTVSGTLGLSGCADTILVLARASGGATIYCRGRDIEEAEHAATFDAETCRWTIVGDAADVHRSEERQRVAEALADGEMSVADLVAATGMVRRNLDKLLHFMVKDGEAVRVRRGVYGPMVHPR